MLRHTCGELNINNVGDEVMLVVGRKNRDLGGMTFVDLRDRYGITQLKSTWTKTLIYAAQLKTGREFVMGRGTVIERRL